MREGNLIERGYLKSYIFFEVHSNFPRFTITPTTKILKIGHETGFVPPF